jgi:hypothetical protein
MDTAQEQPESVSGSRWRSSASSRPTSPPIPGRMAHAQAQILAVHQEDMVACARVQAGLKAADAILGPLSPLEAGVARFRAWVAG